ASGASRRGASRARRRSGRSPAPPSTCASSSPPCGTDRSPLRASDEELANPRRTPENDVKRPLDARSPIAAESAGSRPTLPAAILLAPVAADGLSGGRSATFCNGLFSLGCPNRGRFVLSPRPVKLYIMLHGPAEEYGASGHDSDRALTTDGRLRVRAV